MGEHLRMEKDRFANRVTLGELDVVLCGLKKEWMEGLKMFIAGLGIRK